MAYKRHALKRLLLTVSAAPSAWLHPITCLVVTGRFASERYELWTHKLHAVMPQTLKHPLGLRDREGLCCCAVNPEAEKLQIELSLLGACALDRAHKLQILRSLLGAFASDQPWTWST